MYFALAGQVISGQVEVKESRSNTHLSLNGQMKRSLFKGQKSAVLIPCAFWKHPQSDLEKDEIVYSTSSLQHPYYKH